MTVTAGTAAAPLPPLITPERLVESHPQLSEDQASVAAAAVSAEIRRHAGWHIGPVRSETLVLHGTGERAIFVPTLALREITACSVKWGSTVVELDVATVDEWSEDGRVMYPGGGRWPDRLRSVTMTVSHGLDLDAEGADVPEIASALVGGVLKNPYGFQTASLGPAAVSFGSASELSDVQMRRLQALRIEILP